MLKIKQKSHRYNTNVGGKAYTAHKLRVPLSNLRAASSTPTLCDQQQTPSSWCRLVPTAIPSAILTAIAIPAIAIPAAVLAQRSRCDSSILQHNGVFTSSQEKTHLRLSSREKYQMHKRPLN